MIVSLLVVLVSVVGLVVLMVLLERDDRRLRLALMQSAINTNARFHGKELVRVTDKRKDYYERWAEYYGF